jgi:hypothetical protein
MEKFYASYTVFADAGNESFERVAIECNSFAKVESDLIKKVCRETGEIPDNIYVWEILTEEEMNLLNELDLDIDTAWEE